MNMIVCTCDHCGKVVENWTTLNIGIRDAAWHREICNDCFKEVRNLCENFVDEITVTNLDENK